MSAFHNSRAGERLALKWHQFGTRISFVAFLANLNCALWCFYCSVIMKGLAGIGALIGAGAFVLCCLVALGGVFWHKQAEKDHIEHMREMQAEDYAGET